MKTDINNNTIFEPGKTYEMRSVCDYDSVWRYKVVKRTMKTVILEAENGEEGSGRKRISIWQGVETVQPLGSYSMSPILSADKVVEEESDPEQDPTVKALKAGVIKEYQKLTAGGSK